MFVSFLTGMVAVRGRANEFALPSITEGRGQGELSLVGTIIVNLSFQEVRTKCIIKNATSIRQWLQCPA